MTSTEEIRYHTHTSAEGDAFWTATTRWFSTSGAVTMEEAQKNVRECLEDHFSKSSLAFELLDDLVVYRHPANPQGRETFRTGPSR